MSIYNGSTILHRTQIASNDSNFPSISDSSIIDGREIKEGILDIVVEGTTPSATLTPGYCDGGVWYKGTGVVVTTNVRYLIDVYGIRYLYILINELSGTNPKVSIYFTPIIRD